MSNKILVTDSMFIFDKHIKLLESKGYEVERLDKPSASEEELIEALQDKVGYILGGVEYVTDKVIESANKLKTVVFTGTGYQGHIPGWELARKRNIKIGNTPYANIYEVAEWGLAATLAMQRDLFDLGPQGTTNFHTITSLPDLTIGILGLGHIGKQYANMVNGLGAKEVLYWNRTKKDSKYKYVDKKKLFSDSDIIFVAIGDEVGEDFINSSDLKQMKQDALIVSISHHGIINEGDLFDAVSKGKIRAALDIVKKQALFNELSPERWYASTSSTAYNSHNFLMRSSDMAVATLINLLETGEDQNRVI